MMGRSAGGGGNSSNRQGRVMTAAFFLAFVSFNLATSRVSALASIPHNHERYSPPRIETTRREAIVRPAAVFGALCGWTVEPRARDALAALVTHPSQPPKVDNVDSIPSFVQGTVTIPPNFDFEEAQAKTQVVDPTGKTMTPVPALYITCRPDKPDNVPQAILDGSRGKPPPVLSARFEQPTFPFAFHLTHKDYTLEGQPTTTDDDDDVWWKDSDLIVSARLDMDGIAATRSPEDLVGRSVYQRKQGGEAVELQLMGRGAFGKFATQRK